MTFYQCIYGCLFNLLKLQEKYIHPDADLDGLPLLETKVKLWRVTLGCFHFGQLAFLLHPPFKIRARTCRTLEEQLSCLVQLSS